jgi:taurine dioxygenase
MTSTAPSFNVQRIGSSLGAKVTNLDLTRPLGAADAEAIRAAIAEHEVLVIPNQDITPAQYVQFGRTFGPLTVHPFAPNDGATPEMVVLDNHKNNPPNATDFWHSDETFRETPPMATILRSTIVPPVGGDTLFASMTAAYDGLNERFKKLIDGLEAEHDILIYKKLLGGKPELRQKLRELEDRNPPQQHPVVRTHPVSGRKLVYVNRNFTTRIVGMTDQDSRFILEYLYQQIDTPEYQMRVQWEPHTIVMWDNRSTVHFACRDYFPHRRRMERLVVGGDKPVGLASGLAMTTARPWLGKAPTQEEIDAAEVGETPQRQFAREKAEA